MSTHNEATMYQLDRRQFLRNGATLASAAALPGFAQAGAALRDPDRTLILLQLSGGNDGLSMVVPHGDDAYHRARPGIRIEAKDALRLDSYHGLHPNLKRLQRQWDSGGLGIVQGIGYPEGIRSHFKSLDIWHTGSADGRAAGEGWLGRLNRSWGAGGAVERIVHVGGNAPYSVYSTQYPAVALESPTTYRWFGAGEEKEAYAQASEMGEEPSDPRHVGRDRALARIREVLSDAQVSSTRIRAACGAYRTRVEYPRTPLGAQLHDAAAILNAGLGTRVLSTAVGGFDTHSRQRGRHDTLMNTLDSALGAFLQDLGGSERGKKAVVVVFSEFGRRVTENGSGGTDHGKAGPLLILGHDVRGGLHGRHPSLEQLDEGDLAFQTDFRSVYSTLLRGVLGVDPALILEDQYPELELLG